MFKILIFIGIEHRRFINAAILKNHFSAAYVSSRVSVRFLYSTESLPQHGGRISFPAFGGTDGIAGISGIFLQKGVKVTPNVCHSDNFSADFSEINSSTAPNL